jgi:integrase
MDENQSSEIVVLPSTEIVMAHLPEFHAAANFSAAQDEFNNFLKDKQPNTIFAYRNAILQFENFLTSLHLNVHDMFEDLSQWRKLDYGVCQKFQTFMIEVCHYAPSTINQRMAAVKIWAKYAENFDYIDANTYGKILKIKQRPQRRDEQGKRIHSDIEHAKKANANWLNDSQLERLKEVPLTDPINRRNAVLLTILADLGVRIGEALGMRIENLSLERGTIFFRRGKVKKNTVLRLTKDALKAVSVYMAEDRKGITEGPLLLAHHKSKLTNRPLSRAQAFAIVREAGRRVGCNNLSAHDLRSSFTKRALLHGSPIDAVRRAGGWSGFGTILTYAGDVDVQNDGVILE